MNRILLADDSPQALRLAEQILKTQGLEVVSVSDGAVALRRLDDVNPDLVIADVYLPTRNGFEIARHMRAHDHHRFVPMIFAAAPGDEFDEQDARNAGADVIIRKPFEASALLEAVQQLLEKSAQARASRNGDGNKASLNRAAVRAAVTLALDAAMPMMIEELTERVLAVLGDRMSKA